MVLLKVQQGLAGSLIRASFRPFLFQNSNFSVNHKPRSIALADASGSATSFYFRSSLSLRLSGYSSIALRIEDRIHPLGVLVSVVGGISIAATAIALSSLSGEYR